MALASGIGERKNLAFSSLEPFSINQSNRHARAGGHPICFLSVITKWDPRLRGGDEAVIVIPNNVYTKLIIE